MGTEILHPQDCLIERMRFINPSVLPRRKSFTGNYSNPKSYRKPEPKKRIPSPPLLKAEPLVLKKSTIDDSKQAKNQNLLNKQVTILKRGESLDLKREEETLKTFSGDLIICSSEWKKNENLKKTFSGNLVLCGTERLGPDPEQVPKQIRITDLKPFSPFSSPLNIRSEVYAGSAFSLSPSPRALPLPKFSMKKEEITIVDDSATKDLRRLLRIN